MDKQRVRLAGVFIAVTVVHLIASIVLFLMAFNSSMARFETGAEPGTLEALVTGLSRVLLFPGLYITDLLFPPSAFPGLIGWIPFALNSIAWGCAIAWLIMRRRKPVFAG